MSVKLSAVSVCVVLSLGLGAAFAQAAELRVSLEFPEPEAGTVPGLAQYAKERHPVVPVRIARLLLPQGETVASVSLSGYDERHTPFEPRLAGEQRPLSDAAIVRDVPAWDGQAWPTDWKGEAKVRKFRGYAVAEVPVYPLRAMGRGDGAYIRHATLTVTTKPEPQTYDAPARRETVRDFYEVAETVDNVYLTEGRVVPPEEEIGYMIIGPRALIGTDDDTPLAPLIAQKELQNMQVSLVALEDVSASKDPKQIRDYIRTSYQRMSVDYVLIVGDKGQFPWKYVKSGVNDRSDPVPSDQWYACLDGDMSTPKQIDWACEVAVGRVGAKTRDDVKNWVEKTVQLEQASKAKRNGAFLNFGEKLDSSTLGQRTLDYLINGRDYTPKTQGFPSAVTVTKLYDTFRKEVGASDFIKALNEGDFHVVNHLGHANETYVFRMNASQQSQLRSRPAFYYSEGCYPNDPDTDNWVIRAVRMPKYGPAAMIGNTRYGWYAPGDTDEGTSSVLHRTFWSMLFKDGVRTIGRMNHKAKESAVASDDESHMIYTALESNLIGDPALDLGL